MPLRTKGNECQLKTVTKNVGELPVAFLVCTTKAAGKPCPKEKRQYDLTRDCFDTVTNEDFIAIMVADDQQG